MTYQLKISKSLREINLSQLFRSRIFRNTSSVSDADEFDERCTHFLIFDQLNSNKLVCVFRIYFINDYDQIDKSYSNKYYRLNNLKKINDPMLELGRFCIDPNYNDPKIIMTAWSAIRKIVEYKKIKFLFGCSSFIGTSIDRYLDCFKYLKYKYVAPPKYLPYVKAPQVLKFSKIINLNKFCIRNAKKNLPPLLSSYLNLGGWVSDHAVIDYDLQTMHVFTGLEVEAIPENRLRFLRSFNFNS